MNGSRTKDTTVSFWGHIAPNKVSFPTGNFLKSLLKIKTPLPVRELCPRPSACQASMLSITQT